MKLRVERIRALPVTGRCFVKLISDNEELALNVFHKPITMLPEIEIRRTKNRGGYTVDIPDEFFTILETQKKEFNELVKQNPSTSIYNKFGE